MNIGILRIRVVAKQGLRVLPAIQTRNFTKWSGNCGDEAVRLAIIIVCAFDMSWLDFATMMDDSTGWVNERLGSNKSAFSLMSLDT